MRHTTLHGAHCTAESCKAHTSVSSHGCQGAYGKGAHRGARAAAAASAKLTADRSAACGPAIAWMCAEVRERRLRLPLAWRGGRVAPGRRQREAYHRQTLVRQSSKSLTPRMATATASSRRASRARVFFSHAAVALGEMARDARRAKNREILAAFGACRIVARA